MTYDHDAAAIGTQQMTGRGPDGESLRSYREPRRCGRETVEESSHSELQEVFSMAGSSLLTLIDDISTLLDDVATMSKLALKKTAGVVGDDLALNAQQLVGIKVDRELPVVWAVAKGSIVNKLILVPVALLISAATPWLVLPLLMIGGAFLCYEGFEKILHKWLHRAPAGTDEHLKHHADAVRDESVDLVALEKERIRGAIRTDFILSAEIIVIALEPVAKHPFIQRVGVLTAIAAVMTIGVYGLVAVIIKLDDLGMYLTLRSGSSPSASRTLGRAILAMAPVLMKVLSIAGTAAMFMVGGGILVHGVPAVHHAIEHLAERAGSVAFLGGLWSFVTSSTINGLVGVLAGAAVLGVVATFRKLLK